MLISDTLHYRPDGTVSSITRVIREAYTTPSGRDVTEDVSSTVDLSVVTDQLGAAYAAFDAHNKALEEQIVTERDAAEVEKKALTEQHAQILNAQAAEAERIIATKDVEIEAAKAAKEQVLTALAEKEAALAAVEAPSK